MVSIVQTHKYTCKCKALFWWHGWLLNCTQHSQNRASPEGHTSNGNKQCRTLQIIQEWGGGKRTKSKTEPLRTKVCKLTWAWGIAIFSSSFSLSGFCADTGFKEIFTMFASWVLDRLVCCLVEWAAFLHRPGQFYSRDAVSPPGLSDIRGASSLTNKPCVGLKEKPPRCCQNKTRRPSEQQSFSTKHTTGGLFAE